MTLDQLSFAQGFFTGVAIMFLYKLITQEVLELKQKLKEHKK
jgi:hypothetical protein